MKFYVGDGDYMANDDMILTEEQLKIKEQEEREKKERKRNIFLIIVFMFLLFLSSFGITYSIYKGDNGGDNQIITDKIVFTYSDVNKGGSGIYISNAMPITDDIGKKLTGSREYFDFSVTATSKKTKLRYQILIRKNDVSTLKNENVRVYLAGMTGNYEQVLVLDNFNGLRQTKIDNTDYYILYEKTLDKGIENYTDSYRLRMWVKDGANDYEDKVFSINVDVSAIGVGD